jgi:hypothetical protein
VQTAMPRPGGGTIPGTERFLHLLESPADAPFIAEALARFFEGKARKP